MGGASHSTILTTISLRRPAEWLLCFLEESSKGVQPVEPASALWPQAVRMSAQPTNNETRG